MRSCHCNVLLLEIALIRMRSASRACRHHSIDVLTFGSSAEKSASLERLVVIGGISQRSRNV